MRLTCPNCKAQYEVEDSVIPAAGRDVQCSSCNTTWFQYPASVALQMRSADLDDDDEDAPAPAPEVAGVPGARVDRTVLAVLREEAEREMAARRRARPAMETQSDLGLVSRPTGRTGTTARPDAHDAVGTPGASPDDEAATSRRSLLPDIDELSSTLEPRPEPAEAEAQPDTPKTDRGRDFRRGLSAVILIVAVLIVLYALAPGLAEVIPALSGPLAGYVALIDSLRLSLADLMGAL